MVITKCGTRARFKLQVVKDDQVLRESGWSNNMVLDSGLAAMNNGEFTGRALAVGTGTIPTTASMTKLQNTLALADFANMVHLPAMSYSDPETGEVRGAVRYGFATSAVIGNVTEVGMTCGQFPTVSDYVLWNRALVTDDLGTPTAITVVSGEVLHVIAEITMFVPTTPIEVEIPIKDKNGVVIETLPCTVMYNIRGNFAGQTTSWGSRSTLSEFSAVFYGTSSTISWSGGTATSWSAVGSYLINGVRCIMGRLNFGLSSPINSSGIRWMRTGIIPLSTTNSTPNILYGVLFGRLLTKTSAQQLNLNMGIIFTRHEE